MHALRRASLLFVLVALGVLSGCGVTATSGSSTGAPVLPAGTVGIHMHVTDDRMVYDTPAALCNLSVVADTQVLGADTARGHWDTADGSRAATLSERDAFNGGYRIYTPMAFSRMDVLWDVRSTLHWPQTREFVLMGGTWGPDSVQVDGWPGVHVNTRYVLAFGPGQAANSPNPDHGVMVLWEGFPVTVSANGTAMVTLQHTDVEQGQTVGQNLIIPLDSLRADLARCTV